MTEDQHSSVLTGAYALGSLDEFERARFERHLEVCAECRDEVDSFHETLAALGTAEAVPAPSSMKGSVLQGVAQTRQLRPEVAVSAPRSRVARMFALAACAAGLLVSGGVVGQVLSPAPTPGPLSASSVLEDSHRRTSEVAMGDGRMEVSVVANQAVVSTHDVSAPGEGKVYQLWAMTDSGPVSLGVMHRAGDQYMSLVGELSGANALAVTAEPKGGSTLPTSAAMALVEV
jgi:anti-sigma-K factor RskA